MTNEEVAKDIDLAILALEDSPRDFELTKELLIDAGYSFTIERVETKDAFVASLRSRSWDIILADFKLPGFDAFGALGIRNEFCPGTPFICVSGSIGEETAIDLLKAGAVDYVIKDRPERLPFAIKRALKEARETEVRKQKEVELRKITTAVEQAGEVIFITDSEGNIQYCNPTFTLVTGYSREEILGQNPRILKSGRHDLAFYKDLWDTITAGRVWKGRTINRRKDGTLFTEDATISPVKDESGRILNFVAVKRDITERERMEEDLVTALAQKTRLVAELFHRTNNNMQIIQGLLQYRLSAHPELPLAQFVEDVTGQIQSMAEAQQALFRVGNLSRIDLAEYLPAVVQLVQDRFPDHRGGVSVSLDVKPISILLDSAVPLGLVVNELVTNSLRHAFLDPAKNLGEGKIVVTSRLTKSGEIEVRVSDDGIGWSPADRSTLSGAGGLGLAMALVEHQLGGTITFDGSDGTDCIVLFRDDRYEERV